MEQRRTRPTRPTRHLTSQSVAARRSVTREPPTPDGGLHLGRTCCSSTRRRPDHPHRPTVHDSLGQIGEFISQASSAIEDTDARIASQLGVARRFTPDSIGVRLLLSVER